MKKIELLGHMIGLPVAQCFISFALYVFCAIFSLYVHYVIAGAITFSLYAVIWSFIWSALYAAYGTQHVGLKILSATVPLAICTGFYIWMHPVPTDATMIAVLPRDIHFFFAAAVTGTLLFPIFSTVLLLHMLPPSKKSWIRSVGAASSVVTIGAVIFASCYSLLPTNW